MKKRDTINAGALSQTSILGTFEGECADATITNKNGLDITREVWENVFASDEYKEAIANQWYIGFLGHPDDPADQNFQHACIVMTEGHIADDGKVYGKFNLVDTPVGQIVKKFIDAGVTFGISVRGAGDIISNSVDPDTFIFRGFDLVTFPAYPEAIPTFSAVAASTDAESQQKYKSICAAVSENINGLNTVQAVDIIQSCFAKQSDTYKELEDRKAQLQASEEIDSEDAEDSEAVEDIDDELDSITAARIKGLTQLYINEHKQNAQLIKENVKLKSALKRVECNNSRKIASMKRIMASQLADMDHSIADLGSLHANAIQANKQLKIQSSSQIRKLKDQITSNLDTYNAELKTLKQTNLKYKQKIEASTADIREKDSIIASLKAQVQKTVQDKQSIEADSSNLDATNKKLLAKIEATQALLKEYQDAYANLYAGATGVTLDNVAITATTSTSDLRRLINRAAVTSSEAIEAEDEYIDTVGDEFDDSDELVIL